MHQLRYKIGKRAKEKRAEVEARQRETLRLRGIRVLTLVNCVTMVMVSKLSGSNIKGSFTIIDIYESVHSVRFLMTRSPKSYSKMLIFSK